MKRLGYLAVTAFGAGALAALLLLAVCNPSCAEDYYCVSTTGTKTGAGPSTTDIEAFGWGNSDCYGSIQDALDEMSGGDQCWVDDGTYTETGTVANVTGLSGSSGDYTIIRARNHGDAIITTTGGSGIYGSSISYVRIEGFHIAESAHPSTDAASVYISGTSHHVYVKRCSWASEEGLATGTCTDILWEDCFAYGGPLRYPFQNSTGASRILYRRCLVRWDYTYIDEPTAGFASYESDSIAYQNCVFVDGTDNIGTQRAERGTKGFFDPNGSTNVWYDGCIVMATTGMCGVFEEGSPGATGWFTNCVIWNQTALGADDTGEDYGPTTWQSSSVNANWVIDHCTFGLNDQGLEIPSEGSPIHFQATTGYESMRNCIIYGMSLDTGVYAVSSGLNDGDYNLYYGNTGNRDITGDAYGSNDITGTDPTTSGHLEVEDDLWVLAAGLEDTFVGNRLDPDGRRAFTLERLAKAVGDHHGFAPAHATTPDESGET